MKELVLSLLVLIAAQPALAQVAGTPEEAQKQELSPAEKTVVAAMMAYYVRDARDLCGFKLTAFADRMVAGLEKFPTDEQKALAQTLSNKNRPRAPLAQFCKTAREEIEHSPTKWFAD
jgi:hypothetical protein